MEASGQISRRGIVHLAFERFGQVATVTGKLGMGSGSGTWSSTTMQCAGSWRANRKAETGKVARHCRERWFCRAGQTTITGYAWRPEGCPMSRIPDFSKLALAPAPEQFEDVGARTW